MSDKPTLRAPDKYLRHSEEHFQGYWVQLQSLIRRNDEADELLDGLLENPLLELEEAYSEHKHQTEAEANDEKLPVQKNVHE